jgi:hypothetical protein
MDNDQARFLLHAARPDGRDDADPIFAEALEQARRDPALSHWLEEERRIDAILTAKLTGIEPPADLKAALLTAPKVVLFSTPRQVFSWRLAAIAAVLFVMAVVAGMFMGRPSFAGYEADLYYGQIMSGQVGQLRVVDSRLEVLQDWLAAQGAPIPANLPMAVLEAPSVGCRTFLWHGNPVAQICFQMKDGQIAHLFVIGREGWRAAAPPEGRFRFHHRNDWSMAMWRDEGKTYVLAKAGPEAEIRRLLL